MTVVKKKVKRVKRETVRLAGKKSILGVRGKISNLVKQGTAILQQEWVSYSRQADRDERLRMHIRLSGASPETTFFFIDGRYVKSRASCRREIAMSTFPELSQLSRWNRFTVMGPENYPARPLWQAGEYDLEGLSFGEPHYSKEEILHGLDIPSSRWYHEHQRRPDVGEEYTPGAEKRWLPLTLIDPRADLDSFEFDKMPALLGFGEGSERRLDDARKSAFWPEATDEQLMLPRDELEKVLNERLPGLIKEFRKDMDFIGFVYDYRKL